MYRRNSFNALIYHVLLLSTVLTVYPLLNFTPSPPVFPDLSIYVIDPISTPFSFWPPNSAAIEPP